ncbi:hypothetical protein [Legionella massiliensis]|uniref:hypothetical protein n=1 Tax=Legionella massiliensis TaxID=1034943 RepID=UPI000ADA7EF6|nr:hypothetical protein [Legionella massiliensis]
MQGDFTGALADSTGAINLSPNNSVAFATRRETKLRLGENQGALADLIEAIRLNQTTFQS